MLLHQNIYTELVSEMMSVIRKEAFFFFLKFSMAFRQDSESEHIINSVLVFDILAQCIAFKMANASAL